jgi:hemolysin D
MISNRDIGFVHVGQEAQIKIDTFNFTRYGLLHGRVLNISQDAIIQEASADKRKDRAADTENVSSEPKDQQLNYAARVSLDRTKISVEDAIASLSPGMAVTVEVKTGSRRIISYLLSPILKYQQESLRER